MALKTLTAEDILKDDSASYWLKDNIRLALGINTGITETKRDLIDMINDVEVLQIVLNNILNSFRINCTCGGHEELRDGIKVYHEKCDL